MDTLTETKPSAGGTGRAFRVLVTGSRTWASAGQVQQALTDACRAAAGAGCPQLIVVHGANPSGADKLAANWVRQVRTSALPAPGSPARLRVRAEEHPADWKGSGLAAGPRRNAEMVALGADICLAFVEPCTAVKCKERPAHDSHGTADCITRARDAGIPVRRYES